MKSIEEATEIRHKILYAFEVAERLSDPEERRAWLTFVVVGAGSTGVELAVTGLGRTLAQRTTAETNRGGQIRVGPRLTIANYPDIDVVDDLAGSLDPKGKPLAGVAQVAMQQGTYSEAGPPRAPLRSVPPTVQAAPKAAPHSSRVR
jgi:NADH dehydrogenase FAD-containing subunit